MNDTDATRRSWNIATQNHNAHKGDQAAFFRAGGDTLFPEELELLGSLEGKRLVHLQCNAGQDTLSLSRRGAEALGVDFAGDAISFAERLANESGIAARFIEAEVVEWLGSTSERFDIAFSSYGAAGWLRDIRAWARGIHRVLDAGGRFVYVEFHPILWSIGADLRLSGDDYFSSKPFIQPVSDYVGESGAALHGGDADAVVQTNDVPATSWQHTLADVLDALVAAGLRLQRLVEYPHSNGCKVHEALVPDDGRRWRWPDGAARVPLMFGLAVQKD